MNADDYFADCTADLGDAIERFQADLTFEGDAPGLAQFCLIRLAWENLESKYKLWLEALYELE